MKKILFFMNFSKNNIVLPRNATKATKTTVEVTLPKSSGKAILSCDTFIGCQGLVRGVLGLKTCRFDHFLKIVQTRFLIYILKQNLKKVDFWPFSAFRDAEFEIQLRPARELKKREFLHKLKYFGN